eukprot:CAMPEP_0202897782 /NCGR_PEP_ID=MMETSP1392-20130828/6471_1 /ASSEMBLY_ACC=CAM_ASM_000868 /TAXON_ID=225041 /ORGANISM="Chlamydomonas chlamydogama, Strain SAG 11-48b" /LENGTH=128 /DNA_ID=CAMNT_0049583527 /DNA_START=270 /DNA_END=653 /DNA_ORIENTATION=-
MDSLMRVAMLAPAKINDVSNDVIAQAAHLHGSSAMRDNEPKQLNIAGLYKLSGIDMPPTLDEGLDLDVDPESVAGVGAHEDAPIECSDDEVDEVDLADASSDEDDVPLAELARLRVVEGQRPAATVTT